MPELDVYPAPRRGFVRTSDAGKNPDSRPEKPALPPSPAGRDIAKRKDISAFAAQLRARRERKQAVLDSTKTATQIETLQSKWKSAQQELEEQKRYRAAETARMAERLSSLEEELEAAAERTVAIRGILSKERNRWRSLAVAAGAAALIFLCASLFFLSDSSATPQTTETARVPLATQTASGSAPEPALKRSNALPRDPHAALTAAMDRLDAALSGVPGNPVETLWKVSHAGKGCMLLWSNNAPSVLFGREPLRPNSLAYTLSDCAEAVSRFTATGASNPRP